jgi:hypothetical protein
MSEPYPSSGHSSGRERPPAPAPVLTAVKLMYAGAAVSAVSLLTSLAYTLADLVGTKDAVGEAHLSLPGMGSCSAGHCHAAEVYTFLTLVMVLSLIPVAVWVWMARTNGQGRNWARILSTVLFGLATLELTYATTGNGFSFGVTAFSPVFPALTWLIGAAAVWLLWRPACTAFFHPRGFGQVPPARPTLPGPPPRSW